MIIKNPKKCCFVFMLMLHLNGNKTFFLLFLRSKSTCIDCTTMFVQNTKQALNGWRTVVLRMFRNSHTFNLSADILVLLYIVHCSRYLCWRLYVLHVCDCICGCAHTKTSIVKMIFPLFFSSFLFANKQQLQPSEGIFNLYFDSASQFRLLFP